MGVARLQVRDVRHAFGARRVLEGLSFSVQPGEVYGLLGPNGSGKSTLLRALMGLVRPDAGQLWYDGQALAFGHRRVRESLGVVFQAASVDARLTARENLRLAAALHGLNGRAATEHIERMLALANLSDRAEEPVKTFSGGMRRRLELVRALLSSPRLLILDEPTSGLDERAFQRIWAELQQLRRSQGLSILVATHRSEEAENCDRLAVLDAGRVIAEGTPAELRQQVAGDVITLETDEPAMLVACFAERLGISAQVVDGQVVISQEQGHALVPRLIEAAPAGSIRTLNMRRPALSDVFLALTGRSFGASARPEAA